MSDSAIERNMVDAPQDWDKAVSAAFLYLVGDEVKAAAKAAGVGERTMHRWVRSPWWARACAEARRRWLNDTQNEALRTISKAIRSGDTDSAWKLAERTVPELAPPTKKLEVRGSIQALIASLPADEIRRLRSLPEAERREALQELLGPSAGLLPQGSDG